ncbi:outer membrane efflux protein [Arcobacter nitrofigilis DSM 7299]|uniref:Outer membrane efflux protein n=1 Tax=Arcobacter nitrofigilis (strain ATCC 33309 / DSM 7299 / CCUG 15893 / LMG 7604 / NCTC 12251 / CI) TaxID=572480 RepID=D5V496_ARCNC|nr:TolC family protein [Arcobacter nitrofigilis]ADG91829.1 outer membrane efflux protein [Arcobacter nitrofigilis DSM 7299]
MLRNSFILTCLIITSSFSTSLENIINSAIVNNKNLQAIEKSIQIANEQIKLSNKWDNPILTIGANDLQFDTSRRDLEPMQGQYIGFSQNIPINGKIKLQEEIAMKDKAISNLNYEDAKLKLKSKLIEYLYSIKILEKKYLLLNQYQKNIKSLEDLTTSLYESNKSNQSMIINLKTDYLKIEIQKENLQNIIKNNYLKLEEITYEKITSIDVSLDVKELIFSKDISTHPIIKILEQNNEKFNKQAQLEDAKKLSDIKVSAVYFQRDDKYKDYANVSLSIPLAFYGKENIKILQAKIKAREFKDKLDDSKKRFEIKIASLQNDLDSSIKKYKLLKELILPLQEENQEIIEKYNSLELIKSDEILKNLNKIIQNKIAQYDEMKNYFDAYSQAYYYTQGKIR